MNYYNQEGIKFKTLPAQDDDLRKAYYGGRCEVFGNSIEGDQLFHYDFKGMYTTMMKEEFPLGEPIRNASPNNCANPGFYYVLVKSENMVIPILPYRQKKNGKLIFPNGEFTGLY